MTREAGSYYVIGYGGHVDVPTIDLISREISVVGNLVGSYNDLAELMALTAQGKVRLSTQDLPAHRRPHGAGRPRPREGARRPRHPHLDLSRSGAGALLLRPSGVRRPAGWCTLAR